jgi:hypothetical protein
LLFIGWKFWYGGCTICYRFPHMMWWHIICKRWDWNSAHLHLIANCIFLERDSILFLLWNNIARVPYWNLAFFLPQAKELRVDITVQTTNTSLDTMGLIQPKFHLKERRLTTKFVGMFYDTCNLL